METKLDANRFWDQLIEHSKRASTGQMQNPEQKKAGSRGGNNDSVLAHTAAPSAKIVT